MCCWSGALRSFRTTWRKCGVLRASKLGRVHTLIMRMNAQEATERLMAYSPLLVDAIPLTLEEIFIYELGGADYAVKDIVL